MSFRLPIPKLLASSLEISKSWADSHILRDPSVPYSKESFQQPKMEHAEYNVPFLKAQRIVNRLFSINGINYFKVDVFKSWTVPSLHLNTGVTFGSLSSLRNMHY